MSTVELNGVTVYASAVESVEDGVSQEYDRLWDAFANRPLNTPWELPVEEDHPAVIVKLTSGREFRIVGKTRKEVEQDIFWARKRERY